jgi:protein-S-isoprenylcysteine O-methyltransferase Ste14
MTPFRWALAAANVLAWPGLVLGLGGDGGWIEGWVFAAWFVGFCTFTIGWLARKDPGLLAERYRAPGTGGQSDADLVITFAIGFGFIAWIVLLGLDGRRRQWTPRLPLGAELLGGAMLAGAAFFMFRAFADNTFASPLARIQEERGHRVVSTGVYGTVRHPMYLGAILMFAGAALLCNSLAALAAAAALAAVLIVRIRDEEALLVAKLEGYDDYRRRVRWRLVPHVW